MGVNQAALDAAKPSRIPHFAGLTFFYIGAFLGPLVAVLLMAIREYAKDALELTERDLVLGRILVDTE
jgi:hypothetical protein